MGFGYKVKMTVVKLSFSEKVFLSNGVIAKNYKMYWGGYEYLLYTFPFRSVPKDEFFFNFFLVIMPMRFQEFGGFWAL